MSTEYTNEFQWKLTCSTCDRVVYKENNYSISDLKKKIEIPIAHRNCIGKTMNNVRQIITA